MKKERLDVLMVQRNLAESREKAKALIMSGIVYVNGQKEDKAGTSFEETVQIEVRGSTLKYVSRGGLKLEKAMSRFGVQLAGKVCMDVGASTGGFTDCMLQNGAVKVYAVDVGHGQLAWKLRNDDRVICMEKTNIRYVTPEDIGDRIEFASIDVSFISLTKVLGPVKQLLTDEGQVVCLIKPQFEAGREKVGKKGVVREKSVHLEVIEMVMDYARSIGFGILGLEFSPIKGPEGNIEYLLYLQNILQENGGQEDNVQKITGEKTTDQEEMNQSKTEHAEMKQTENHQAKRNQTEYELSARAIVEQAHGCLD
ncbi:TlyA family RNA methyltransferase [Enterocloster bolteae]|uniref:TlyA family RNA methyltransferase n=1 Tax=Enterocloster bolteae TaxID=208479 RepID=UPI002A7FFF71|nr:TlyA family RNA methyltransferase [Enterocloster bolteae]